VASDVGGAAADRSANSVRTPIRARTTVGRSFPSIHAESAVSTGAAIQTAALAAMSPIDAYAHLCIEDGTSRRKLDRKRNQHEQRREYNQRYGGKQEVQPPVGTLRVHGRYGLHLRGTSGCMPIIHDADCLRRFGPVG
jgi:hypothetical protein